MHDMVFRAGSAVLMVLAVYGAVGIAAAGLAGWARRSGLFWVRFGLGRAPGQLPQVDPGVEKPWLLIVGNPTDGFSYYGPTTLDDDEGSREARTLMLDENGEEWWLAELRPLSDLPTIEQVQQRTFELARQVK